MFGLPKIPTIQKIEETVKNVDMKNKEVKLPSLSIDNESEQKKPSVVPSRIYTYVVRIISVLSSDINEDLYRVRVWPEHLELLAKETKTELGDGGALTFEQTLTFHHEAPFSEFILRLEKVQTLMSIEPESQTSAESVESVGTGSVLVPTKQRTSIEDNVTIYDEDQHDKGKIKVSVLYQSSPEKNSFI